MRPSQVLLAAVLTCAPTLLYAQAAAPELPRAVVSTVMPATTRVLSVSATGNLQAALDSAKGGDAIELACGATYTGHFTLPVKSGTGWLVVRPSCATQLPASGTRMTPATAASLKLPKIVTPDYQAALSTTLGAHHYRLVGLEVTVAPAQPMNYGLVLLGAGDVDQTTQASIAHDLVLDRLYIHGTDTVSLKRCVGLNSASTAIVDSYLSECHADGQDAQAVGGWNGSGPYLLENNYLEGSAENILFGGGDPHVPGLVPSDITIRHNYVAKPASWHGGRWLVKNLLEFKNAQRVLIEGNVFDGSWQNGQEGAAMVLWSANQDKTAPWTAMQDVTIRDNMIRRVGAGLSIAATAYNVPSMPARRIAITDNLVYAMNGPGYEGNGRAFQIGGGDSALADLTIAHNTVLGSTLTALTLTGKPTLRLVVTNNILEGGSYGIIGDGTAVGAGSWTAFAPGGVFTGNVLTTTEGYVFPPGNSYPTSIAALGLDSLYRLPAASPYQGAGATSTVLAATAGVASGTPGQTPTPVPTPVPTPIPSPVVAALSLTELRAAITALDKATGPSGRENLSTKNALLPVDAYLKALLTAITSGAQP